MGDINWNNIYDGNPTLDEVFERIKLLNSLKKSNRIDEEIFSYAILGLENGVSKEELLSRHTELAKNFHPDKYQDDTQRKKANEIQTTINVAKDYLKDRLSNSQSISLTTNTTSSPVRSTYNTRRRVVKIEKTGCFKRALAIGIALITAIGVSVGVYFLGYNKGAEKAENNPSATGDSIDGKDKLTEDQRKIQDALDNMTPSEIASEFERKLDDNYETLESLEEFSASTDEEQDEYIEKISTMELVNALAEYIGERANQEELVHLVEEDMLPEITASALGVTTEYYESLSKDVRKELEEITTCFMLELLNAVTNDAYRPNDGLSEEEFQRYMNEYQIVLGRNETTNGIITASRGTLETAVELSLCYYENLYNGTIDFGRARKKNS